jgi:hypothetical protein
MEHYHNTFTSLVSITACKQAFLKAIKDSGWTMQRCAEVRRLICREPNVRGEFIEHLVTVEISFDYAPKQQTRIDVNAYTKRTGESGRVYAKYVTEGLLRTVESTVRPQKVYAS